MKTSKQSVKFKTRFTSIIVCLALVLCAVLSFGFTLPRSRAAGEDDTASTTAENNVGIRFVQVAAGADFAIGLSYDGKIYGWSLLANRSTATSFNTGATTLGGYYTGTPTEIEFSFLVGPGSEGRNQWNANGTGSAMYHTTYETYNIGKEESAKLSAKVKYIAATRTSAALVTTDNYIYTWGKDDADAYMSDTNTYPHYLLYRETTDNDTRPWYRPYIIHYQYGDTNEAIGFFTPKYTDNNNGIAGDVTINQIEGSENNYIISFRRGTQNYLYVWGSRLYSLPNTAIKDGDPYDYVSSTSGTENGSEMASGYTNLYVYRTDLATGSLVAGGYNIGVNNGELHLRGKNFLTSESVTTTTGTITTSPYIKAVSGGTSDIAFGDSTVVKNAVIGGKGNGVGSNGIILGPASSEGGSSNKEFDAEGSNKNIYYAKQDFDLTYKTNSQVALKDAHNAPINGTADLKAIQYGVSLGNEVGYGIAGADENGGNLYVWGDNSKGQYGNTTSISSANVAQVTGISNVVAVAAGKQLSGSVKAFNSLTGTFDSANTNDFVAGAKNGEDFISGAIKSDGSLLIWSNKNTDLTPITYGDTVNVTEADKFIAVYSGYGNHIFALTAVGKLMHIEWDAENNNYKKTRYDTFGGVTNWTVNSGNTFSFAAKTAPALDTNGAPQAATFDTATFYVWSATNTANVTDENTDGKYSNYNSLVATNAVGDVYRILGLQNESKKTNLVRTDSINAENDETTGNNAYAPTFRFGTTAMRPEQAANMFTTKVVYDAQKGVGIQITPLRSSRGQTVTVDFYIARYNSADAFSATAATTDGVTTYTLTDLATYYDIKKCSISFTIADTPTIKVFNAFRAATEEGKTSGNSNIPVLDPNNVDNKYYSIALQNVSGGIQALAAYLTTDSEAQAKIVSDIIGDKNTQGCMVTADAGFPAQAKIGDGNLDYYLGSDAALFYNNAYQYLYYDGDGDRIVAASDTVNMNPGSGGTSGAVTGKVIPITIRVQIADGLWKSAINTDFDNVYGLYNIKYDGSYLSFTYDVIQFEASKSTGDITYKAASGVSNVSGYVTDDQSRRLNASINANTRVIGFDNDGNNNNFQPTGTSSIAFNIANFAGVFSQPSLRLNTKLDDGTYYYGASDASTALRTRTITIGDPVYVGKGTTIKLENYIGEYGSHIRFAYNNSIDYSNFNKQFVDETGNNRTIISLSDGLNIVVTPTIAKNIDFEIAIQRFSDTANRAVFGRAVTTGGTTSTVYDEKILVRFVFTNIIDFSFTATSENTVWTINKTEKISLFDDAEAINNAYANISIADPDARTTLTNAVRIVEIVSSETGKNDNLRLFKYTPIGNRSIEIEPLVSGTGTLQFIATVYGKSLFFSLTFHVSAKTTLNSSVTVVDDQYLYISDIKNKLIQANTFEDQDSHNAELDDYNVLVNDIRNPEESSAIKKVYNAFYFTNAAGETVQPGFVSNVVIEGRTTSEPTIRIVAGETSKDNDVTFYMHVKFVRGNFTTYVDAEAEEGNVLEVIIPVVSGKIIIPMTIAINCKSPADTEYVSYNETHGVNTQATINMATLLDSINVEASNLYDVFLVSSGSNTSNYFNYAPSANKKSVVISPLYNTPRNEEDNQPEPVEINVSVSNGSRYMVVSFYITVDGILTTLPLSKSTGDGTTIGYGEIWLYSFLIVFGVLLIIFIIRLIVYFRKRAKQRALIKRNQELIRMRDRMHNKANAASKEQVVKTKLKMEDPKYAKLFNDMRKNKEEESGILLENSDLAATADAKTKKNKKKKAGKKKSVAELKAELEAKKAAFAAAQQNAQPVNPFEADVPMGDPGFGAPNDGFGDPNGFGGDGFGDPNGFGGDGFGGDAFSAEPMDGGEIVFDASDLGDGM
ncbi:MAG: hypothetical protein HDT28_06025 [Clostridiales bacterium]|nr:hypothetical protein [Clostridiales bacterium]